MSEARHHRFEIDLDEIERQLRRSVEGAPAPKPDPLAELARIVGQDDPFKGILGEVRPRADHDPARRPMAAPPRVHGPAGQGLGSDGEAVFHGVHADPPHEDGPAGDDLFDPVADAYGSADDAVDESTFIPLRPRRTRRRLASVMAALCVIVVGTGGYFAWQHSGRLGLSGPPPVIKADTSPIKVAPEHPGGIEIPNQNKQIYEREAREGKSRVVDNREQPMDVREAVRNSPAPPQVTAPETGPGGPAAAASSPVDPAGGPVPARPTFAGAPGQNSLANALGEPRKVRTVSVRPDGTMFETPAARMGAASPTMSIPMSALPSPISVATIPIGPGGAPAASSPAAQQPAAADTQTSEAGTTPSSGPAPVTVLPPQRPKLGRSSSATPAAGASRIASGSEEPNTTGSMPDAIQAQAPAEPAGPGVAAAPGTYSVQIAVQPSEDEARKTYARLSAKYPTELDGKPAGLVRAEVKGKTLYRVRVGPMARDGANTLCTRLKASGAQCFVAAN